VPKSNNIVREPMMIEIKSSRRPRHKKGCSAEEEEEEEEDSIFVRNDAYNLLLCLKQNCDPGYHDHVCDNRFSQNLVKRA
jgi:hypothetical protein